MNDLNFTTQSSFLHHGIQGQKWGVQNGPPYPLDRKKARAERKAARADAKEQKKIAKINRKSAELAAKTAKAQQSTQYAKAKNELAKQKATYKDMKRDKWTKDLITGETQKEKISRSERDREFALRAQQQKYNQKQNQPTLGNTIKKTLIDVSGVLLKDAATSIGKDIVERKLVNPYLDKHKSSATKEYESNEKRNKKQKQEADYWESKSKMEKAKWQIDNPKTAYGNSKYDELINKLEEDKEKNK